MADGTSFEIDVDVGSKGVEPAAVAIARLGSRLTEAGAASVAAAAAVKTGEAAYKAAEAAADRAAKAVEKIGLLSDAQSGKLAAALATGDTGAIAAAEAALERLNARQAEATLRAGTAAAAMNQQAATVDSLRSAAAAAAEEQADVTAAMNATAVASKQADAAERSMIATLNAIKAVNDATAKSFVSRAAAGVKASKDEAAAAAKAASVMSKTSNAGRGGGAKELAEGLGQLGGPLGSIGQKSAGAIEGLKKLSSVAGSVGPYVALAAVVVGVSVALVAATAAVAAWALGLADANRSAELLSDGIAGTVAGGRKLDSAIAALESRLPQTSDELRSMAADLAKTGLQGDALTDALESAAVKAAKLKWGPNFAKGANTATKLAARLQKNISGIFGGLNIEGVLAGLSRVVALFDSTSATGQAIKVVFESIFQPLLDGIEAFIPKAIAGFIQFQIWVMKALIAIKPFGSYIELAATVIGVALLAVVAVVAIVVAYIVILAAAAATFVGGVIYLAVKLAELTGMFDLFAAGIKFASEFFVSSFTAIMTSASSVIEYLRGLSLADIGAAMIDGLVAGITGAAGGILTAITGAVGGAIDAAKGLLGIASPSKVFAEIGTNTGEGMAEGVDSSAAGVAASLESMVAPPPSIAAPSTTTTALDAMVSPPSPVQSAAPAAAPAEAATAGAGGGGHTFQITINAEGGGGESIAAAVKDAILSILEGDVAQLGGAVPT